MFRAGFRFVVPVAMPLMTPVVNKNSFYCVRAEYGSADFVCCESSAKTVDTYSRSGDCCGYRAKAAS